ncbi:MAG TPA: DEAD/DEAH box helicase [Agitococcus sp.]|nr:DEAD/DEAH box helicase [Agitococcus sp.]HNB20585.1 DEAD/DEAH box helicase [Agitococcus sp.]HNC03723.1 DEAD/DEAH box helicase [Agitococcus sp.]
MNLRPYQQNAVDSAIQYIRKTKAPCLLELATGAGKSWIAAAIAHWVTTNTHKKVLVLQPSKELTEQNYDKFLATGQKASIFSASAGSKCTRYDVVYGTPKTVLNKIDRFGDKFACVIIDEAHMITPTIKEIIKRIKQRNNNLRVIGMTATPYRMYTGYIYSQDETTGRALNDDLAINPYFASLIYSIKTRELISMGFLTEAHTEATTAHYDADKLELNSRGQFNANEVSSVFENQERLTSLIVQDVMQKAQNRKGVMFFASTVRHAQEIMQSLPSDNAMMLGGDINMDKRTREKLISDFKAQKYKYIVSVGTLTTGFDAPHVDCIAVLRATESASLFQQIIGRGLRLADGKNDCLVLDYAENIKRHDLFIDMFEPTIKTKKQGESECIDVSCPFCGMTNSFALRKNPDKQKIDEQGYFLDLAGNRVLLGFDKKDKPLYMPAHYGRRCNGFVKSPLNDGELWLCEYRWAYKECENCGHENDIAARYCENKQCKHELVDPNEKLNIQHAQANRDSNKPIIERVLFFTVTKRVSKAGNNMLMVDYVTKNTNFRAFFVCDFDKAFVVKRWKMLNESLFGQDVIFQSVHDFMDNYTNQMPITVTYKRNQNTKYIDVLNHNEELIA